MRGHDEIAQMMRALASFKQSLVSTATLKAEAEAAEERNRASRKADLQAFARGFEAKVGAIVTSVSTASKELEQAARSLSVTAEGTKQLTFSAAEVSAQASANVHSVASATEEMSMTIDEISRQVHQSSSMAMNAVGEARETPIAASVSFWMQPPASAQS